MKYNEIKSKWEIENKKLIKKYYFNNTEITKKQLLDHIKFMVKTNNNLFYKELKENNFNWSKVNGFLLNYKQVKNDILNNGLIYHYYIELAI